MILGSPHTGVELLSRLLAAYPASLLVSDPGSSVLAPGQEEARTARRLSWVVRRIFQCDLSVLTSLASTGALTQYGDQVRPSHDWNSHHHHHHLRLTGGPQSGEC